jgi:hypothetical protein
MIRRAAVSLLLTVALAGCTTGAGRPTPEPTPAPTVAPTPQETPTAEPGTPGPTTALSCDLVASADPWDGAAGSRFTAMTLSSEGPSGCVDPVVRSFALVDAGGATVAAHAPWGDDGRVVQVGGSLELTLRFSNVCGDGPALPVTLRLVLDSGDVEVAAAAVTVAGDLPPCNAPGEASSLEVTEDAE